MVPETVWPEALDETNSGKELYRNYLIPITMVISIMVLLINLIHYNFWQATGLTIINLIPMAGFYYPGRCWMRSESIRKWCWLRRIR